MLMVIMMFGVDDDVISVSLDGGVAATIVMPDIEGSNGVAVRLPLDHYLTGC